MIWSRSIELCIHFFLLLIFFLDVVYFDSVIVDSITFCHLQITIFFDLWRFKIEIILIPYIW